MAKVVPPFERPTADPVSRAIIGAAIAVHGRLGPGLLESVYQECLELELSTRGVSCERERRIALSYAGRTLDSHLRIDLLVERQVVVEVKCVERLLAIHRAQPITYLRMGSFRRGLLINFNVPRLIDGLIRVVL